MIDIRKKMGEAPYFENLGPIDDPFDFSRCCKDIFNHEGFDQPLEWTAAHGYKLNSIPQQFHPVILKAVDIHEQTHGQSMTACWVHYNQGILPPRATFRIGGIHFDAFPDTYPITKYPNNDVFLVSDTLPTQFALQSYDMPETIGETDGDLNQRITGILQEQTAERHIVTPDAYDMVRYDSFTVHRAQPSQHCIKRTFLMIRFS